MISVIDVGSNAIRLVVAEKKAGKTLVVHKHREAIRLGADVFSTGEVSPDLIEKTIEAFKKFKKISNKMGSEKIVAIGTSALRNAENRSQLIGRIEKDTGILLKTVSGQEESLLVYEAINNAVPLNQKNSLLIDIGGGSVELVAIENGRILKSQSFPLGTVRLLEKLKNSPPDTAGFQFIEGQIKEALDFISQLSMNFDFAVGIGGNFERMLKIQRKIKEQTLDKQNELHLDQLHQMYDLAQSYSFGKRMKVFQLRSDQADVLIPALITVLCLLQAAKTQQLYVPGVGIKDSLIEQNI